MMSTQTWTERMRKAMEQDQKRGRTLYRIAKDAGLPYQAVHRFWHGQVDLRAGNLERLARALGFELARKKGR